MAVTQPAYVEAWDSLKFPDLDARKSEASRYRFDPDTDPALFHQRVALVRGLDTEGMESWMVVKGDPLVAKRMVEWCGGDDDTHDLQGWINKAERAAERDERDWRKQWSEHPALVDALSEGAETLFERAGLSVEQFAAMRLFWQGEERAVIAERLGLSQDAARMRVERAIQKIIEFAGAERSGPVIGT